MKKISGFMYVDGKPVDFQLEEREGKKGLSGKLGEDSLFAFPGSDGTISLSMRSDGKFLNLGTLNGSVNKNGKNCLVGNLLAGRHEGEVCIYIKEGFEVVGVSSQSKSETSEPEESASIPATSESADAAQESDAGSAEVSQEPDPQPKSESASVTGDEGKESQQVDGETAERTKGDLPAIKAFGYEGDGDQRARFELALWPMKNKSGYAGTYRNDNVIAYRDTERKDGAPASSTAPLRIMRSVGEGENKKLATVVELFPMQNARRPTLGNAKQGIFLTVDSGAELVGLQDKKPEDAPCP